MKRKIFIICLAPMMALGFLIGLIVVPSVGAGSSNLVGLVVAFGDGSYITRCVAFTEPAISGYEALERSALDIVATDGMVCDIEGVSGCSEDYCLCAYPNYWSYWHLVDGAWVYSGVGASAYQVYDGDVEGWRWGTGEAPPVLLFDDICNSPARPHQIFLPIVLKQRRAP